MSPDLDLWSTVWIFDIYSDLKWNEMEIQCDYQSANRGLKIYFCGNVTAGSFIFKKQQKASSLSTFLASWCWIQTAHYFTDGLMSWLFICVTKRRVIVRVIKSAGEPALDKRSQRIWQTNTPCWWHDPSELDRVSCCGPVCFECV